MTDDAQKFEDVCDHLALDLAERAYAVVDDFLVPGAVAEMRERVRTLYGGGALKEAGIGKDHRFQVNESVRKDKIHWIDPNEDVPATRQFAQRLRELMRFINRHCFLGLKDCEMHYTMYPKGAYYKRHLDQFKTNDHRRLTFLCYLNDGWTKQDGGVLRLYCKDAGGAETPVDILPSGGRFVCFRSDLLEHEVLVCHRERYSLTGWLLDQLNDVAFLKM